MEKLAVKLSYIKDDENIIIENIFKHRNYFLIGRALDNNDVVRDKYASRYHAMLLTCYGACYLVSYALNGSHYSPLKKKFSSDSVIASFQELYLRTAKHTYQSHIEAKLEAHRMIKTGTVANIPSYQAGAYKSINDIQALISMALDPQDVQFLAAMGTQIENKSYIGIGGKKGSARQYYVEIMS